MTIEEVREKEAALNLDYLDAVIRATRIRARLAPDGPLHVRAGMGDQGAAEDLEAARAELAETEARADELFEQRQAVRDEISLGNEIEKEVA